MIYLIFTSLVVGILALKFAKKLQWEEGFRRRRKERKDQGLGERSKYAGCIIKQDMIDTLEKRYVELGGKLKDV